MTEVEYFPLFSDTLSNNFAFVFFLVLKLTLSITAESTLPNYYEIPYFSAHCISDHRISNPNPDPSPDHDYSRLLVRTAVVRNAVGRKGGHRITKGVRGSFTLCINTLLVRTIGNCKILLRVKILLLY